jgi:hypothetical protein
MAYGRAIHATTHNGIDLLDQFRLSLRSKAVRFFARGVCSSIQAPWIGEGNTGR